MAGFLPIFEEASPSEVESARLIVERHHSKSSGSGGSVRNLGVQLDRGVMRELEHQKVWLQHYLGDNYMGELSPKDRLAKRKELSRINRLINQSNRNMGFDRSKQCRVWEAEGHNKRLRLSSGVPVEVKKTWDFTTLLPVSGVGIGANLEGVEPATSLPTCPTCNAVLKPATLCCAKAKVVDRGNGRLKVGREKAKGETKKVREPKQKMVWVWETTTTTYKDGTTKVEIERIKVPEGEVMR